MHEDKIRQALVELLYRNAFGVVISNITTSAAAAFVLRHTVDRGWLGTWLGLVCLLSLVRAAVARRFAYHAATTMTTARWAWLGATFSWLSGALWGALGWVGFIPQEPLVFSFTMVAMTGIVCGSVPSLSAFPPALIGSILTTTIPVAVRCLQTGGDIAEPFLFLVVTLVAINLFYCRSTYRMLRQTIALRLENERLAVDIAGERDRAQGANQAKTRFLAAASHDLRQPIHALGLLVTTLAMLGQRGDVPAPKAIDLAGRARSLVGNLSGLLNALLDISKLDAGIITADRQPIALNALFDNLKSEFAAEARQRGLAFRVVGREIDVDSDPSLLKTILNNLLSNAFRYTRSGGVLLGCRTRGDAVEIQVWDTGDGIAQHQQELIFEEFLQLHNPERDRSQGLGLGLAIVKRTAALLGHPLRLRSREGRGSLFAITVPVAAPLRPIRTDDRPDVQRRSFGIVVVDDQREALDAIATLLRLDGHRVHAGDSAQAVTTQLVSAAGDDAAIDLIIADYRLRDDTTGLAAIADLRRHLRRDVPAIIMTGDTSPQRLKEVAASGVRLLHKPLDGEELLHLVQRCVGDNR